MTQSVGQLLTAPAAEEGSARNADADRAKRELWTRAVAAAHDELKEARTYRVTLCQMVFSEVDVFGVLLGIERLAERSVADARVKMPCAPSAVKIQVKHFGEWCAVEFAPVDSLDHESPRAWQIRKPKVAPPSESKG